MSRSFSLVLALLCAVVGAAQTSVLPFDRSVDLNKGWGHVIRIGADTDYNSNTLWNEMPLGIYRGSTLSRELRERSLQQMTAGDNRAVISGSGRLTWAGPACLRGLPGWRPVFNLAYHEVVGARFTRDQYALTFFGNADYEGRTAFLAPSGYEQVRYQTIGGGIEHQRSRSFVRLDLVRGQAFSALDAQRASLFTGTDGRTLRSVVQGDYFASDTAGGSFDRTNGLGGAFSGQWNGTYRMGKRTVLVGLGVEDLGFVRWNDNSVRIEKDTLIVYEGWQVDNIFALDEVIVNEDVLLDTLGLRYSSGPFVRLLPFLVHASVNVDVGKTGRIGISVDQRNVTGYVPHISLLGSRRFGTRTLLGATASVGGGGELRFGLAAKRRFGEHVLVQLSSPHVPGFFTGRTRGAGLSFGVEVGF